MRSVGRKTDFEKNADSDRRKLELSLILEFAAEDYRGADGEVNEDLMCREALSYVAETANQDEIEISRVNEEHGH